MNKTQIVRSKPEEIIFTLDDPHYYPRRNTPSGCGCITLVAFVFVGYIILSLALKGLFS